MNESKVGRKEKKYKTLDRVAHERLPGSDLKGLTMAGRAQKELDERDVAKGNMGQGLQRHLVSILSSFFSLPLCPVLSLKGTSAVGAS